MADSRALTSFSFVTHYRSAPSRTVTASAAVERSVLILVRLSMPKTAANASSKRDPPISVLGVTENIWGKGGRTVQLFNSWERTNAISIFLFGVDSLRRLRFLPIRKVWASSTEFDLNASAAKRT
jgi:hypothetical protein